MTRYAPPPPARDTKDFAEAWEVMLSPSPADPETLIAACRVVATHARDGREVSARETLRIMGVPLHPTPQSKGLRHG